MTTDDAAGTTAASNARPASGIAQRGDGLDVVDQLAFPCGDAPVVTVLVPTFGNLAMTARCLASIQSHSPRVSHEVVVVEDASGDSAMDALAAVPGLQYRRSERNLGFLRSCNFAARDARGEFLFMLNNDTEVTSGWLDEALALFARFPACGVVGSRLLFPDGRLQEAGGIVWADASAWNFGRGGDAAHAQFDYVREVDYCSGAALLVRTRTFVDAGGFDERYAPAYYEDTDLSLRLRQQGLKTLYCPRSVVIHHEGGSHGTDATGGTKAFQARNRQVFRDRWRSVLDRRHFRNGHRVFRAKEHARHRRVVLVVDHTLPQPERDAGSRAILQTMLQLAQMGLLVKFWPDDQRYDAGLARVLNDAGIETVIGTHWGCVFADYARAVGSEFDYAIVSRPNFAGPYVEALRRHSGARLLYFGHDVHHRRMAAQADVSGNVSERADARAMFVVERDLWNAVDANIYPSDDEAAYVAAHVGWPKVHEVPLYFFGDDELMPSPEPRQPGRLLFVACFGHPPNEDAAEWLVHDILPRIRAQAPDVELYLVGSLPTERVLALAGLGVHVTGAVSHEVLEAHYRAATVAITPMRFGAGVKLKVLEAMARGVPLVTTSVGAQGLPGLERCVRVHDDPAALAAAVVELLQAPAEATQGADLAREYVRDRYSAKGMRSALWRAIASTVQNTGLSAST